MKVTPETDAPSLPSPSSDAVAAWLLSAAGAGADASTQQVVASLVATCGDISNALTPIIGPRGVAALYHRSVHMAGQAQPVLAGVAEGIPTRIDLSALELQLAAQTPAVAAAAGGLLLHSFRELLSGLIGASLTAQLLRTAWPHSVALPNSPLSKTPQDPKP